MTEKQKYDVVVIGSGPGGYVAAIKAAQKKGIKVCLIERELIGGTCLNVGCIPTKTLLASAAVMHTVKTAHEFGIGVGSVSCDFGKMKDRKDSVVAKLRKSLEGLIKSNTIVILRGQAEFLSQQEIKVRGQDNCLVQGNHIIVATGSQPLDIAAFPCDHKKIFNSSSILEMTTLPSSIAIIGGGYIGCEFASLYAALGVKVTILEALPSIVMLQGKAIAEALTRAFTKKGIELRTNVAVDSIDTTASGVNVRLKDGSTVSADIALVAVGRKVVTDGLGLEHAGVKTGSKGEILVNEKMETNVPGIYAIGDVTGLFMLAHAASHQGIVAAANATGQTAAMHYNAVPAVIFTDPEVASVGMTLEQALEKGFTATIGKFPFQALSKAIAANHTDGFAQIVCDGKTGQILGAQVVGHDASVLIAEITLAMTGELTIETIMDTIHAHPTTAESWLEAALLANKTPIHFPPVT